LYLCNLTLKHFNLKERENQKYGSYFFKVLRIKDLMESCIVGTGSDYLVVQKENKRYIIEILPSSIKELKNASTPYGSQID
jgi:hypothetical protein